MSNRRFSPSGRHPVIDVVQPVQVDHQLASDTQVEDRQLAVVHEMSFAGIDLDRRTVHALGQDHTRLLERLPDRRDPVGQPA